MKLTINALSSLKLHWHRNEFGKQLDSILLSFVVREGELRGLVLCGKWKSEPLVIPTSHPEPFREVKNIPSKYQRRPLSRS